MHIEIVYGLKEEQYLYGMDVPEGTTVAQAIEDSPLLKQHPEIEVNQVGIFAKLVKMETVLKEGDRIEIYRPLKIDPRKRRREKVEKERLDEKRKV